MKPYPRVYGHLFPDDGYSVFLLLITGEHGIKHYEIYSCEDKPELKGLKFYYVHPYELTFDDIINNRYYNIGNKSFWIEL